MANYNFLNRIQQSGGLKKLSLEQQKILCYEIRQKLISTVSENGGHLASNLGVVELTVALHTVFDFPRDALVWDVGHQCYTHKLLTGRLGQFSTLRQEGGLSGFPRSEENPCDAFLAGHASTSVSAACGLAKAKTLTGDPHHVIAVVGDGAFTGGMIYEALNNAGRSGDRIIVILNDNDMSISKSVGSLARYLAQKRASEGYLNLKNKVEDVLRRIPVVGGELRDTISDAKTAFRQYLYHSNFFEDFGFDYLGPVDGHDIQAMAQMLRHAKELNKPVVVHVNTVKGKGCAYAEKNPARYHGVGKFDRFTGEIKASGENFSSRFGKTLMKFARKDKKICAITAAMQAGTGLNEFAAVFAPQNRFFDVGIAEEHAVTFACGLAAGGMMPVFAVYSTFLQRGFDQIIHDAAIEQRHIVLAVDRAGIVGEDGETHQGLFDAAFLSEIPEMRIYSPATFAELEYALDRALYHCAGPVAVRYPRGGEIAVPADCAAGDWYHQKNGGERLIVSYGRVFAQAWEAAEKLSADGKKFDLLKLNQIAPIPEECLRIARKYRSIYFLEEGIYAGGIGEHLLSALSARQYRGQVHIRAVRTPFLPTMTVEAGFRRCGLDAESVMRELLELYF